jgi:hypothetical protein
VASAVEAGAGLVTFDPDWPLAARARSRVVEGDIVVAGGRHWITARHPAVERYRTGASMVLRPAGGGTPLASAGGATLVSAFRFGEGRVVRWATLRWASPLVLGPLGGLDDLVWRGFAWAARKPFALRGLPPLVAMRVDDVAGRGGLWGRSPLYWVGESIRAGFNPWIGTFIYNLSPRTLAELRPWLARGIVTESPHAFGRRPVGGNRSFHHAPDAVPLPGGDLDDFIYYDHYNRRPWPAREANRRLAAVDAWYASRGLPRRGGVLIPHWYEAGLSVFPHIHDRWGVRFTSVVKDPETPGEWKSPWLVGGPFRREGPRGPSHPRWWRKDCVGYRPVYYADFARFGGRRFFNCVTEVRDVAGYEWRPDNDTALTVDRGTRILTRAIDSMALAVLFTHETDHIWKIRPDRWRDAIRGVARGIAGRSPRFVTLEEGVRIVRATRTSRLASCGVDEEGRVAADFEGSADVETSFHLFTESAGAIGTRLLRVPPFRGRARVRLGPPR